MKTRRMLSGILIAFGCATAFIGLLALWLPQVQNAQLQLVLASFAAPSDNLLIAAVNGLMLFAFSNSWQVAVTGAGALGIGIWLFGRFSGERPAEREAYRRPPEMPTSPPPSAQPNPFAVATFENDFASFAPAASAPPSQTGYTATLPACEAAADEPLPYARPSSAAEKQTVPPDAPAAKPPAFAAEVRALEAEADLPSQSGSRLIVKPMAAPPPIAQAAPSEPVAPTPPAPLAPPDAPAAEDSVPSAPASSRIRSTMGRHREW